MELQLWLQSELQRLAPVLRLELWLELWPVLRLELWLVSRLPPELRPVSRPELPPELWPELLLVSRPQPELRLQQCRAAAGSSRAVVCH